MYKKKTIFAMYNKKTVFAGKQNIMDNLIFFIEDKLIFIFDKEGKFLNNMLF